VLVGFCARRRGKSWTMIFHLLKASSAIACVETGLHMNDNSRKLRISRSGEEHRQFGVGAFRVRQCADLFNPERHFFCHRWLFHSRKRISQLVNTLSVEAFCGRIMRRARRWVLSVRADFDRLCSKQKGRLQGCAGTAVTMRTKVRGPAIPIAIPANFNVGQSVGWRPFSSWAARSRRCRCLNYITRPRVHG
jgi:hypothetical protein